MKSFSLENEHGDDLIPGTEEYSEYVRGATSMNDLVEDAAIIALTDRYVNTPAIEKDGYYGISILHLGSHAARLVENRTLNDFVGLYFDTADSYYDGDKRALTVEGVTKSPDFAIDCLLRAAEVARENEALVTSIRPIDNGDKK